MLLFSLVLSAKDISVIVYLKGNDSLSGMTLMSDFSNRGDIIRNIKADNNESQQRFLSYFGSTDISVNHFHDYI